MSNQIKIIAGKLRGRNIDFPNIEGLRPTANRIRETLFNWLQMDIVDSVCVDLFAGSGALGFEAISRGARQVYFVDRDPVVILALKDNAERLGVMDACVFVLLDALTEDLSIADDIDLVFLDPPFNKGLLLPAIEKLKSDLKLVKGGLVYVEVEIGFGEEALKDQLKAVGFELLKLKSTAALCYGLFAS